MTRLLSALRRFSDSETAQDVCAFVAMISFMAVAGGGLAWVAATVAAARALP